MNDNERIKSILAETEYGYIGYDNLHGDDEHGIGLIEKELKRALPEKPLTKETGAWVSKIFYCPVCKTKLEIRYNCHRCRQAIDWRTDDE